MLIFKIEKGVQSMKVVIIGGGSAGMAAATRLRRMDENAEIVILEKGTEFAVASCGLTYLLSGVIHDKDELVGASIEQMRNVFRIEVKLNHEVIGIERKEKKLLIENRSPETYDKLIIATGALQLRPDIPGILGDNIFTIRSLEGIEKINDYYFGTAASKVLILGAGDIGIEAAEAFVRLKAKVTLVDMNDHILPYFDKDMTSRLEKELQDKGIKLHLGKKITSFEETEAWLDDGSKIKYDLAIIATGVKPDVKLPVMADLDVGESGGILVNKQMQTNDEDIYACGDNVEIINRITQRAERWPNASNALKQARVAADNISGTAEKFTDVVGTNIAKVFDYTAAITGCSEAKLQQAGIDYQKVYLLQNDHASYYPGAAQMQLKLLFAANGRILGMEIVGKAGVAERINAVSVQLQHNGTVDDLIFEEVAYAPPYSTAKDALNNIGSLAKEVVDGKLRYIGVEELTAEMLPVDVRSPDNFAKGHLPGAVNFPLASIRENLSSLPRNKKIVLYCSHGYGAYLAYCILSQRGFDNAYLLLPKPGLV